MSFHRFHPGNACGVGRVGWGGARKNLVNYSLVKAFYLTLWVHLIRR